MAHGQRALAAIRTAGVVSNVGFMYRWLDIVSKARDLLEGRRLAAIHSTFLCGPALDMNIPGWFFLKERSGGPLLDQAIHVLDLHRYFAGEVASVYCVGNNRIRPKSETFTIEDTYTLSLTFASGVIGSHTHSWACEPGRGTVELISDHLRLEIDLLANRLRGVVDGHPVDLAPEDDCYLTEVRHFLAAVEGRDHARMRSPYGDGLRTAAVTWAALESVAGGQVRVPTAV
jgi:predicted dehydrogenase